MPQIYDMGQTALLPLRRKACWGFFRPKNPTASTGFEPADLGTKGQHATPRPPKLSEVRVHPVISSCNQLLHSSHPPDSRYVVSFLRHVRTEAMHIIRVDCEARIVLYISHRHRIANSPSCEIGVIDVQSDSLRYYTYAFMVLYINAIVSENCVCAGIILFTCECLRYRLLVGPMWCV